MKMLLFLAILSTLNLALADDVGRFQIISAKIFVASDTPPNHGTIDGIFKLDTQTGQTWRYTLASTTNGINEAWVPVPNLKTYTTTNTP